MNINCMNRLMRTALLGAVFIGYQAELKTAASSTVVTRLAEAGVLNNFTLGFASGASFIALTSRAAKSIDVYTYSSATAMTVITTSLVPLTPYLRGDALLDESFLWGFALGAVIASIYEVSTLGREKRAEEALRTLANKEYKHGSRKTQVAQLTRERDNFQNRLLNASLEQAHLATQRIVLQTQQDAFLRRIDTLEEQQAGFRNYIHELEGEHENFVIRIADLMQESDNKAAIINRLDQIRHSLVSAHALGSLGAKGETQQCLVCLEEKSVADFVRLFCGHADACKECVVEGIKMMLTSKDSRHAACTNPDCGKLLRIADFCGAFALDLDDIFALATKSDCGLSVLVGELLNERNEIEYQSYFNEIGGGHCPGINCSFRFVKKNEPQSIVCERCKIQFCTHCPILHTNDLTCVQAHAAQSPDAAIAASEAFIRANTKPCPQCRAAVEKRADGCNHMECTRCPAHFCYNCNGTLPAHPYDLTNRRLSCGCPMWPAPPIAAQAQPVQDEQAQ